MQWSRTLTYSLRLWNILVVTDSTQSLYKKESEHTRVMKQIQLTNLILENNISANQKFSNQKIANRILTNQNIAKRISTNHSTGIRISSIHNTSTNQNIANRISTNHNSANKLSVNYNVEHRKQNIDNQNIAYRISQMITKWQTENHINVSSDVHVTQ